MKRHSFDTSTGITLAALATVGSLMTLTAMPASAVSDWLEVIVGFGMLLAIGLGGLWFTQHQMKFR